MGDFLLLISGVISGGIITWVIAFIYYERASLDLKKEAGELRKQTKLMLKAMEDAKFVKFTRDEQGNFIGLVVEIEPKDVVMGSHVSPPDIDKPE